MKTRILFRAATYVHPMGYWELQTRHPWSPFWTMRGSHTALAAAIAHAERIAPSQKGARDLVQQAHLSATAQELLDALEGLVSVEGSETISYAERQRRNGVAVNAISKVYRGQP